MTEEIDTRSPRWSSTAKLVVAFTFVAVIGALLIRFRNIVGPLLLSFIFSYLLYPIVAWLNRSTRLTWRICVNLIFVLAIAILITIFTITGFAVVQQVQNMVRVVTQFVNNLPEFVTGLSETIYFIGPIQIDMSQVLGQFNLNQIIEQLLAIVQPLLGRAGGVVSAVASFTASTLGWTAFIFLVAYFILSDAKRLVRQISDFEIPGHHADIQRLARQLGRIWNAFMRGQVSLFFLTVIIAFILLSTLGVRNALGLALLAGMARFVPYVGPFITWTVTGLVAFFQSGNYLGLEAHWYTLLVVGTIILLDQVFDNIITPRLFGEALGIHPAALLVAAIISANLIGFVGLLIAAPVLATLLLVLRYAARKMLDLDPWPEPERVDQIVFPGLSTLRAAAASIGMRIQARRRDARENERTANRDDSGNQ